MGISFADLRDDGEWRLSLMRGYIEVCHVFFHHGGVLVIFWRRRRWVFIFVFVHSEELMSKMALSLRENGI